MKDPMQKDFSFVRGGNCQDAYNKALKIHQTDVQDPNVLDQSCIDYLYLLYQYPPIAELNHE